MRGYINIIEIPETEKSAFQNYPYKIHESQIFCTELSYNYNGFFSGDKNGEIKFCKFGFNGQVKEMGVANGFNYEGVRDLSLSPKEIKIASCHEDKNV